jgi:hypothetical protein
MPLPVEREAEREKGGGVKRGEWAIPRELKPSRRLSKVSVRATCRFRSFHHANGGDAGNTIDRTLLKKKGNVDTVAIQLATSL